MKQTATDVVMAYIEERISDGTWTPGMKIATEPKLKEALKVSKGAVREAVERLVARGCLYKRQGAGTYVRALGPEALITTSFPAALLSWETIDNCLDVLEILAPVCFRRVFFHWAPRKTRRLEELLRNMERSSGEAFWRADADFHRALTEETGNPVLDRLMEALLNASLREDPTWSDAVAWSEIRAHRLILDAIQENDEEMASLLIRRHAHRALPERPEAVGEDPSPVPADSALPWTSLPEILSRLPEDSEEIPEDAEDLEPLPEEPESPPWAQTGSASESAPAQEPPQTKNPAAKKAPAKEKKPASRKSAPPKAPASSVSASELSGQTVLEDLPSYPDPFVRDAPLPSDPGQQDLIRILSAGYPEEAPPDPPADFPQLFDPWQQGSGQDLEIPLDPVPQASLETPQPQGEQESEPPEDESAEPAAPLLLEEPEPNIPGEPEESVPPADPTQPETAYQADEARTPAPPQDVAPDDSAALNPGPADNPEPPASAAPGETAPEPPVPQAPAKPSRTAKKTSTAKKASTAKKTSSTKKASSAKKPAAKAASSAGKKTSSAAAKTAGKKAPAASARKG